MKRLMQRVLGVAFIALILGAAVVPAVQAQEQEARPVLGGHRFIWNPYTESPFPRTYVRSRTGGGLFTGLEFFPEFDIGEDITVDAVKGDLLFAELEFEYQHQIQPWLGMWAKLGGLARLGNGAGALLAEGVTSVTGWDIGWLFKMYESESFVLSGTAALSNDGVTDVNLLRWVEGVVDEDPDAELVSSSPRLRGRGGLRAGWGINETVGLQFMSEVGYGESGVKGEENNTSWDNAATVSVDLYPATDFPIGFALTGSSRQYPREGGASDRTADISLRTAFTGRDNFLIALDTSWNSFDLPSADDVGLFRAGLSLQLYF
jgi:hypothetical protein